MSATQVELSELLKLRFAAKGIDLSSKRRLSRTQTGLKLASFRGRGIDFDQHRIYQAGDDVRNIDWRVTARTGSAYTKLFSEEQERPVLIATDYSPSMWFGSRRAYKAVAAAEAAAILAWAALNNKDRVGGLVFNQQQDRESRPRSGRNGVMSLLNLLADRELQTTAANQLAAGQSADSQLTNSASGSLNNQAADQDVTSDAATRLNPATHKSSKHNASANIATASPLANAMAGLRHVARPGTLIFILSDFYHLNEDAVKQISMLAKHAEIVLVHVVDPIEKNLPSRGYYPLQVGDTVRRVPLITKKQRESYLQPYLGRVKKLHQLRKHQIQIRELLTEKSAEITLKQILGSHHGQQISGE